MSKNILIVEDDVDGQAVVAHIAGHLQHPHTVVGDAEQAIQLLDTAPNTFRAVIIDLALPGKDGWQLLAHIRAKPATAGLLCIAITAFHSSRTREEALRLGFDAYFAKPLDATHFARELEALL